MMIQTMVEATAGKIEGRKNTERKKPFPILRGFKRSARSRESEMETGTKSAV